MATAKLLTNCMCQLYKFKWVSLKKERKKRKHLYKFSPATTKRHFYDITLGLFLFFNESHKNNKVSSYVYNLNISNELKVMASFFIQRIYDLHLEVKRANATHT